MGDADGAIGRQNLMVAQWPQKLIDHPIEPTYSQQSGGCREKFRPVMADLI
jgi:hypothetical protein